MAQGQSIHMAPVEAKTGSRTSSSELHLEPREQWVHLNSGAPKVQPSFEAETATVHFCKMSTCPVLDKVMEGKSRQQKNKAGTKGSYKLSLLREHWVVPGGWGWAKGWGRAGKRLQKVGGADDVTSESTRRNMEASPGGLSAPRQVLLCRTLCEEVHSGAVASHVEIFRQTLTCRVMW